jgi:hypothetical protein
VALNEEQLETVKTRWTIDGDSAGQIAAGLHVTRNVVIGVIHRRGWVQAGGAATRPRPRLPMAPREPKVSKPLPPPRKTALELDPEKFVAFDQLGPHHCRYPVDAGGKGGMYCGATPNESPYCDGHAAIVYQPQQPRKIKRPR